MQSLSPEIHIFDVCGTLFRDDTTVGFIRWHQQRTGQKAKALLLWLIFSPESPGNFLIKVLERLTGKHLAKHLAFRTLKGVSIESAAHSAREYVDFLLERRKIEPIFHNLRSAQDAEHRVVLASASIHPVIEELASRLNAEYVSSQLETRDHAFTGCLEQGLSGRKVEQLRKGVNAELFDGICHGYTDNFSDESLLRLCRHQTVVLHKPKHRARWSLTEAKYLNLWEIRPSDA